MAKKKRSRTEDEEGENDYDDDDRYDDDDEEEEEDAPRKKSGKRKKRKKRNTLIDMEAEEEEGEDDEDEEDMVDPGLIDDEVDDPEIRREHEQMRQQRMAQDRALRNDDHEALARYFTERYETMDDDTGAPDTSDIAQQSLLPTIRDPRLYMVRCTKPGHERKAIFSLLQKKFNLSRKGVELGILSAVAPEHLKGRIYIEAYSAGQVQLALDGLVLFSTRTLKMVEVEEMPDVLKLGKRPDKQVNGNWVRIKRKESIYKGDLAQVCNVREGSNDGYVTIRLIPRLDLKTEKDLIENKEDVYEDEKNNGLRRTGRPPQMLFDKKELFRLTGSSDVVSQRNQETGEIFDVWNDNIYRFGLLYMQRVSVKSLMVGDKVQPSVEELEGWIVAEKLMKMMFEDDPTSMDAEVAARGLELDINSVAGRNKTKLFKGDLVRVTHGEQRGLEGKIESLSQDVVMVRIPEVPEPVQVNRAHITKTFKIGEHVKVSSGKNAGNTGAIVGVDGDFLTIFSDTTREEIKVLSSQVADSADFNTEVASNNRPLNTPHNVRYELFDLVQMLADPNEKGVIIQVQNDSVTILTPQNARKVVPIASIKGKIRDESVRASDARGNPIAPNDTIHVMTGPMQNRQGVVKHVAGNTIFFKARDEVNNCGILAVIASACTASGAAARHLTSTMTNNPSMKNPTPIPRGAVGMFGRGGGFSGGRGGRSKDSLLRKEVKMKTGPFKGYTGKVVDVNERTIRVEITSKMKTITTTRDKVKEVGAGNDANSSVSSRTAGAGSASSYGRRLESNSSVPVSAFRGFTPRLDQSRYTQTPKIGDRNMYGQTPSRANNYATPRISHQTPSHLNTPAHHAMTPGRDDFRPSNTPFRGFGNSGTNNKNPYASTRPTTPAASTMDANPYTPYMPQTPSTPAATGSGMPTTPMGGGMNTNGGGMDDNDPNTSGDASNTYGDGMEPRTPGIVEPTTPAYGGLEPRTPAPGLEPATPAPPMEPQTPAPAGQEPRTPAVGMEPSTPMVEPTTPHTPAIMPQTPHPQEDGANGPGGSGDGVDGGAPLGYRVLIDVEVLVTSRGNSPAKVVDAASDGSSVKVRILSGDTKGDIIEIPLEEITPVQPRPEVGEVQELIKVLDGPYAGKTGRLQSVVSGLDDMEGYIKFLDGNEATLNMSLVAKCSEE